MGAKILAESTVRDIGSVAMWLDSVYVCLCATMRIELFHFAFAFFNFGSGLDAVFVTRRTEHSAMGHIECTQKLSFK